MISSLSDWEERFQKEFSKLEKGKLQQAGILLELIPQHSDWELFLQIVRTEWVTWKNELNKFPYSMIILFGGIAFYEYEDNTFWPQFADCVGTDSIDPNHQQEITSQYIRAVNNIGLKLIARTRKPQENFPPNGKFTSLYRLINVERHEYVGTAVYQIGIPLSLWGGFLDICDWALLREDWDSLSDDQWREQIDKRTGGRKRLKRFLLENRENARNFIKEMLDARRILSEDLSIQFNDIAQASILRAEYFEEVPETADFLRPEKPESLLKDRIRIFWDDRLYQISLHLPSVEQKYLPSSWTSGTITRQATSTPDEIPLNNLAFQKRIELKLVSEDREDVKYIKGLDSWGLFDMENGYMVNTRSEVLHIGRYVLVSLNQVKIKRNGFEEEHPINEFYHLPDGTNCYVTYLLPFQKHASLKVDSTNIQFRTHSRIESRFLFGLGYKAAFYEQLKDEKIKVESIPLTYIWIPKGYFPDIENALNNMFEVKIGERVSSGNWSKLESDIDSETDIFCWPRYSFLEKPRTGTIKDPKDLSKFFCSPDLKGDRILSVESKIYRQSLKIYLDHSVRGMEECWSNLPGAYLIWFLLCQSKNGMKWEDIMFAKDVIAPKGYVSYYLLKKYQDLGFLRLRGRYWEIVESRAILKMTDENSFLKMKFIGNPSILWVLYRYMLQVHRGEKMPTIEVVDKRGDVPYLQILWEKTYEYEIREFLKKKGVKLVKMLWNH